MLAPTGSLLTTDRLHIRPVAPGDEDAVHVLFSDERVVRHTLIPLHDREQARDFVARVGAELASESPARMAFALMERESGELVGVCGLVFKPMLRDAELWYVLRPDRWGRGLAAEAARAVVGHAFGPLGLHRVWASVLPENPASVRVLEKLGFRREGELRKNLPIGGRWRDSYLYALLAEEWEAGAAPS